MTATSVPWLLAAGIVVYVVGGTVGFGLWLLTRLEPLRQTQPHGWPLPLPPRMLFAHQAYVLGGGVLLSLALPLMTPVLQRMAAPTYLLGCAIVLVGLGALTAVVDVWAITRSRQAARRQRTDAHPNEAPPSR